MQDHYFLHHHHDIIFQDYNNMQPRGAITCCFIRLLCNPTWLLHDSMSPNIKISARYGGIFLYKIRSLVYIIKRQFCLMASDTNARRAKILREMLFCQYRICLGDFERSNLKIFTAFAEWCRHVMGVSLTIWIFCAMPSCFWHVMLSDFALADLYLFFLIYFYRKIYNV